MVRLRSHLRAQDGFSVVEVMVAAVIALVGLGGTLKLLDNATAMSTSTQARTGAVALQRELVEAVRGVAYDQLTPNSVVAKVQAGVGLGDASLGDGGWTIRRRGVTYTVSLGVCSVDDPRDGTGAHSAGIFCTTGAGGTSPAQCRSILGISGSVQGSGAAASGGASIGDCGVDLDLDGTVDGLVDTAGSLCVGVCLTTQDTAPEDYKRVVSLVRWDRGQGSRYSLQATTLANPGLSGAPAVTTLTDVAAQVTSATQLTFSATTSMAPETVAWSLDGTQQGTAAGAGTAWGFTWPLGTVSAGGTPTSGEVLDGSYVVGAKAYDEYGQAGATRSTTVVLNRRAPYPVQGFRAGRNGSVVEFEWAASKERDVIGYRVYRQPTIGSAVLVCSTSGATACRDTSPPASALVTYYAVALDATPAGATREGQASASDTVLATNSAPNPPATLSASTSGGATVLSWTAPTVADPDLGDSIDFYRVYRDGTAYEDRYDRTATGAQLTWTDTRTNGQTHTYWVAAVDTQLAESPKTGPVTR